MCHKVLHESWICINNLLSFPHLLPYAVACAVPHCEMMRMLEMGCTEVGWDHKTKPNPNLGGCDLIKKQTNANQR